MPFRHALLAPICASAVLLSTGILAAEDLIRKMPATVAVQSQPLPADADSSLLGTTVQRPTTQSGTIWGFQPPTVGDYWTQGKCSNSASELLPMGTATVLAPNCAEEAWTWQCLPDGLIYRSYLAGGREPRLGSQLFYEKRQGWLWDGTVGGRVGIVRYGTRDEVWPEGWQLDFEGAAFPRLSVDRSSDIITTDFRFGVPLTWRRGFWESKLAYYHLSSHLGDEFMEDFDSMSRINYVRETVVFGIGLRPDENLRVYGEVGYGFHNSGGSKPWEFQFGAEYCPGQPTGAWGAPFLAVNGHLREEVQFNGNLTAQAGWAWRGDSGHLLRMGAHYFNGKSDQAQFFDRFEEQIGAGVWYDY